MNAVIPEAAARVKQRPDLKEIAPGDGAAKLFFHILLACLPIGQ
jgi:hypothetical protein